MIGGSCGGFDYAKLRRKSGVWGTRHLRVGKAHRRSLGFARDDKSKLGSNLEIYQWSEGWGG
jgi:hypothetical protein